MNIMDRYTLQSTVLIVLTLGVVDAFLVWALYSIITMIGSGISALDIGVIIIGGILLYLFGSLIIIGVILVTMALLAFLWGIISNG